ncbi:MAG: hypothetical protein LBC02_12030 [Planctomycetaceae bacterium]|jgi:hypothetical protein|nr:hypothetical protein [Planctomycetaceae bacterium]
MKNYFYCLLLKRLFLMIPLLMLLFFNGCNNERKRPDEMPTLYRCTLCFTQENIPLADAVVSLYPVSQAFSWTIGGRTDENGTAEIFTDAYFRGLPEGEFKIVVRKFEVVTPKPPDVLPQNDDEISRMFNNINRNIHEYSLVDVQFSDVKSSPLTLTVKKSKNNETFELGKKVRVKIR